MELKSAYVAAYGKSRTTSFLLTLFFGPLGLFYTSAGAAVGFIIAAIATGATVVGPIIVWIVSICVGDHMTVKVNKRVSADYDLKSSS